MPPATYPADPVYPEPVWTDQVDFRPLPYQPVRPSAMKLSLVAAGVVFFASTALIGGSLARLPDIDPMADPGLVVDYAAQPPADRGLLVVTPTLLAAR